MRQTAEVVVCGAGIAGVAAAYQLAKAGIRNIVIVDPLPPLSLTSDRSTECYRNWWPDADMLALMNRSIDLMEELAARSGNVIRMNRRGYLYLTGDDRRLPEFRRRTELVAGLGAGPLRIHSTSTAGYMPDEPPLTGEAPGADLLLDPDLIHRNFPYVAGTAIAALHVRRAGWLSAQQLGMHLIESARSLGVQLQGGIIDRVEIRGGRVAGVVLGSGEGIDCPCLVNAAGPYLKQVGALMGVEIPVETELHLKVTFKDHLGVVSRNAPLLIWDDPQLLPWAPDEWAALRDDPETAWLAESFPAGAHMRPEGQADSQSLLMLWDYRPRRMQPEFPPPLDELYPEIALRGLATMVPGLRRYFGHVPRPYLDGGYYVKTPENRLLAGPLPVDGAFVIGALSGLGIMSACGAADLLSAHVTGAALPAYASAFSISRYTDPDYQGVQADLDYTGQL